MLVIFIHGVLSDAKNAWTSENGANWPRLLAEHTSSLDISIATFEYWTHFSSSDYGIQDAAEALASRLKAYTFKQLVLVGHSMGGLVARYFLVAQQYVLKIRILVFLVSSPTTGSFYADVISALGFTKILGHKQAAQLTTNNDFLTTLNNLFGHLLENKNNIFVDGVIESGRFRLVDEKGQKFINSIRRIEYDHIKIAKPKNISDDQSIALLNFMHKKLHRLKIPVPTQRVSRITQNVATTAQVSRPILSSGKHDLLRYFSALNTLVVLRELFISFDPDGVWVEFGSDRVKLDEPQVPLNIKGREIVFSLSDNLDNDRDHLGLNVFGENKWLYMK